jgi:hypothetical protein
MLFQSLECCGRGYARLTDLRIPAASSAFGLRDSLHYVACMYAGIL